MARQHRQPRPSRRNRHRPAYKDHGGCLRGRRNRGLNNRPLWGYKRLSNLVQEDPNRILLTLGFEENRFLEFLNSKEIRKDLVALVLKAFSKIIHSNHRANLGSFLSAVISDSNFLQGHITSYLVQLTPVECDSVHRQALADIVALLSHLHHSLSTVSHTSVLVVMTVLESTLKKLATNCDLPLLMNSFDELNKELKHYTENLLPGQPPKKKARTEEPPNDFREIAIFPQPDDIHFGEKPFLRENIVSGKYDSVNHYLDVQFRLLREDFIRPLREGILEYYHLNKEGKIMRSKDFRTYTDVHVIKSILTNSGMIHCIQFDITKLKQVKWQTTKRLMYGSLLCLSPDGFENLLFASVSGHKVEDLEKGQLEIHFLGTDNEFLSISPLTSFTMAESPSYFEAYRHNLSVLQEISDDTLAMKDYIVSVKKEVCSPHYLKTDSTYDLRTLEVKSSKLCSIPILNDNAWPSASELHLDHSQYKALKMSLTREFSIIQGPPGTGKTYIGLRIVEILLKNSHYWSSDGTQPLLDDNFLNDFLDDDDDLASQKRQDKYPILLVCYTNHALDQFVEGVSKFTDSIVRIGGKCKLEAVSRFSLAKVRQSRKEKGDIRINICRRINKFWFRMKAIQQQINKFEFNINKSLHNLLEVVELSPFMHPKQEESLLYSQAGNALMEWLHVSNIRQHVMRQFWDQDYVVIDEVVDEEPEADANEDDFPENADVAEVGPHAEQIPDPAGENDEEADDVAEFIEEIRMIEEEEEEYRVEMDRAPLNFPEPGVMEEADNGNEWRQKGDEKKKFLQKQLKSDDRMTGDEAKRIGNVWNLSLRDRWRLYRYWADLCIKKMHVDLIQLRNQYAHESKKYEEVLIQRDVEIIEKAKVIAMTTTGAAKFRSTMKIIKPRIVIVEEAAEVLEAHIVTSLSENTQHLILIGDHQQLRPTPTVFQLAKKYNLEISLFERMIKNGMPYACLETQHRMRPEISSLLVPAIYSSLKNHESVCAYEHIRGVTTNMYFINHDVPENRETESKSYANYHEVDFIVQLCKYLILQGYESSQITILTMYSGQFFAIRRSLKRIPLCREVKVCVVDNFQGEENDIILLSFVRSNMEGSVGFLKTDNRVCVALSRARKGMYCIGNFDLLAEGSNLWAMIKSDLITRRAIGPSLRLMCQNHPNKVHECQSSRDFTLLSPEGGCYEPCEYRLRCGHVCIRSCHVYDKDHLEIKCTKICGKSQDTCDHACSSKCHNVEPCPPCSVHVQKVRSCGHTVVVACSKDPDSAICLHPCPNLLTCGHKCAGQCSSPCITKCKVRVEFGSPCGHKVVINCSDATNNSIVLGSCRERCKSVLSCGHSCEGTCGTCIQGCLHKPCNVKCGRKLICGHICKAPCASECPPCKERCENRCIHSRCPKTCGEPCVPCLEPCAWKCKHLKCTKRCSETCDRPPCNQHCRKRLRCGHNHLCIGLCGDYCPRKCLVCNRRDLTTIVFGSEDEKGARFVQLEDCNHVVEVNALTQWMEQSDEGDKTSIQLKVCPLCSTPIRKSVRFGNVIRNSLDAIEKVKQKYFGNLKENNSKRAVLKNTLLSLMNSFYMYCNYSPFTKLEVLLRELQSRLYERRAIDKSSLFLIENYLNFIQRLLDVSKIFKMNIEYSGCYLFEDDTLSDVAEFKFTKERLSTVISYLCKHSERASMQQLINVDAEIHRVALLAKAHTFWSKYGASLIPSAKEKYQKAVQCLTKLQPLDQEDEKTFLENLKEANKLAGGAVLGITSEEKRQILQAMNLSKGHWYSCPNGHVYCIADCGGAVIESECNECKAKIGGSCHRIRSDNHIATAMDGATHSAYPHGAGD